MASKKSLRSLKFLNLFCFESGRDIKETVSKFQHTDYLDETAGCTYVNYLPRIKDINVN